MKEKILLEKNRSKYSVNTDSYINLDLSGKSRLLPFDDISDKLSLNQLYMDERDNCNKYRMIFTVNPICSNVLFNARTEVIRYEGSSACTVLGSSAYIDSFSASNTTDLNLMQSIRDTEYSHPDIFEDGVPFVYHCGFDIFNNHMLRNNDFVFVNKLKNRADGNNFNTIRDVVRDNDGNVIKENVTPGQPYNPLTDDTTKQPIHLYQYDTILTMYDAFVQRLKVKDGWYGFNNLTNITKPNVNIKNNEFVTVNKILNNNKSCEFIDMYPDRSLYSFVPKMNKYRRRTEKNWDYCITYPFKKEKDLLNRICGIDTTISENNGGCSIKILEAKRTYSSSGNNLVRFKSMFRHNFKIGDYIKLYYVENDSLTKFNKRIKIVGVGDYEGNEENRYFSISYTDLNGKFNIADASLVGSPYPEQIIDDRGKPVQFYYKKDVDGVECQYYFRRFTRILNENGKDLNSDINKLAYGENIYGDRIAQIVFTDDINVEGLVDHRGRPLTDVYFTVMKRNAGWKEWYPDSGLPSGYSSTVEFSHCFGKVTSGIEMPEEVHDYNVRKLHNVDATKFANSGDIFSSEFSAIPKTIESNITYEHSYFSTTDGTIGDLVEYNPIEDIEIVLEIVEHRFNTAQRETPNPIYSGITYDEMVSDDYDFKYDGNISSDGGGERNGFNVEIKDINISRKIVGESVSEISCPGNISPEGYFYNPYTKVKIKELSEDVNKVIGRVIKIVSSRRISSTTLRVETSVNYGLIKNDTLCIYNNNTKETYWGTITNVEGKTIDIYLEDSTIFNKDKCSIVSTLEGVPGYATYLPSSHSFVWRNIVLMSELENDSAIYNMPFSNGRNYIEQNITFYLKRQDPTGEYGLLKYDNGAPYSCSLNGYKIKGWNPVNLSNDLYNKGNLGRICY